MQRAKRAWISAITSTVILFSSPVWAQESRGSIVGRVADSSGAVVPNAIIRVTSESTNVPIETRTNYQGAYEILFLTPGLYKVTVEMPGFKALERDGVEVRSGDRVPLDVALPVGDLSETVVVSGTTPLLESVTANVGQVIGTRNMTDLPTPYGNPRTFFMLMPGVNQTFATGVKYQQATLPYISSLLSINGAPLGTTQMTIDSIPNVQTVNAAKMGISHQPPADAVTEVKIETPYEASVGYTSGANFNMVVRSGTNALHGTAYFFNRSPSFYANSFFANRAGQPIGDFFDRRWGVTAGGPIYLPKVYKGKNRTFWFYSFEKYDYQLPVNPFTGTVPTIVERNGDFSALLKLGPAYQIYDPSTIAPAGNGRFSRMPLPNNVIPANRISSIARAISKFWPEPNTSGTPDGTNNYVNQNNTTPTTYYNHTVRVDHTFTDKYRIYGHYIHSQKTEGPYNDYLANLASGALYLTGPTSAMVDITFIPTPTLVVNVRYGYNRHPVQQQPKSQNFDLTSLGFPSSVVDELAFRNPKARLFPRVDVAELATLNQFQALIYANDIHTFSTDVDRPVGNHALKVGFDLRAYRENRYDFGNATPNFVFTSDYTNGPVDNSPTSPLGIGQGYASLLLGIPTSGVVDYNSSQASQSKFWALYFQDNWRVHRTLTLTLGVRYEYEVPLTERFNRSVRGFDPTAELAITRAAQANYSANPIAEIPVSQFQVRGGLLFAGVNGQPRTLYDADRRKWMPRVGLAYAPRPNTVLRAGYGIYFLPTGQPFGTLAQQLGFSQSTFIVPTVNNGQSFTATLDNPFPTGILGPPGNSQGVNTFVGRGVTFFNSSLKSAYNQRWNFSVQQLLPQKILLEVGYAGSRVVRLPITKDLNALPDQYLSRLQARDTALINRLTSQVTNPFYPLLPGTNLAGQAVQVQQLLRPYPQFSSVVTNVNQGYSWYHSLQVRGERRFARGYSILGAYTFSKLMEATTFLNAGDALPYRSLSAADRRHHLSLSGIVELPFGRGKAVGGAAPPFLREVIGGWQLQATWQLYGGEPLGFGNVFFYGDPNSIKLSGDARSIDEWINVNAGFERNVARQPALNFRTAPLRYSGLRAPIYNNWDASLIKNTRIREWLNVQFRAEAFNVLNHPSFAAPDTAVTSQAFGTITAENSNPRQLQLAVRLVW